MQFKKTSFITIIVTFVLFNSSAFAQLRAPNTLNPLLQTKGGFAVGGQFFDYQYEEPGLMNNKGIKFGAFVDLTQRAGNGGYWTLGARYAYGDVTYTGSGTKEDNPDRIWDFRFIFGKDIKVVKHALSPYIGLGYRNLYNDLRGTTSANAVGYRRDSQYLYIPLGVTYRLPLGKYSRLSTTVEYDYLIEGRQKSYLADVGPVYEAVYGNPVNTQRNGHGKKFNIAIEQRHWAFGVFYNYWDIGQSQINYYLGGAAYIYEPENSTKETGIQIRYHF